jgi:glycogen debranching enzyme
VLDLLVSHKIKDDKLERNTDEDIGFALSNKKGGFLNFGINSKYQGVFFRKEGEVFKVIDDIKIDSEIIELRNNFWNIVRCRRDVNESFFMPFGTDVMVYGLSKEFGAEFLFDVKKPYDNRTWGRNYKVSQENNKVIVEFTKTTDDREDSSHGQEEYKVYLAIDADNPVLLDEWVQKDYNFDRARGSYPAERFVFKGLRTKSKKIIMAFSFDKKEAIKACNNVKKHLQKFKDLQKKYSEVSIKKIKDKRINFAAKCAIESLDNLLVSDNNNINLYAGLPWFFQFWSRDVMISLKGLILDKEYDTVKKILMQHLHYIQDDGLLPNIMPGSAIKSADSIGWYFKRLDDFISALRKDRQLSKYFKKSDLLFLIKRLEECVNNVFKNYTENNLVRNKNQETWMDSLFEGDGREGMRIEIQALRLEMYDFMYRLTENKIYKDMELKLKAKVKKEFWNGSYLEDGTGDNTIRPNVFIAAYIYPDLLSKEEWKRCFEKILPKLWLEWGGLATIDKNHSHFHDNHTGEDARSYHRGDSWFWLNNLAALVMFRLDYNRFRKYVDGILSASSEDILFKGFIGGHSELSSASSQKAQGCLNQAWSNAFFLELAEEINSKN